MARRKDALHHADDAETAPAKQNPTHQGFSLATSYPQLLKVGLDPTRQFRHRLLEIGQLRLDVTQDLYLTH
jgi:hypothetical protein